MKVILVLLLFISVNCYSQKSVYIVEFAAGLSQGMRDEVIYHPNALFRRFPNLNRNFWDIRVQGSKGFLNTQWDADHVLKLAVNASHVAAVVIKFGEKPTGKRWKRVKKYAWEAIKYYGCYKVGFFVSYNIINHNRL